MEGQLIDLFRFFLDCLQTLGFPLGEVFSDNGLFREIVSYWVHENGLSAGSFKMQATYARCPDFSCSTVVSSYGSKVMED